MTAISQHEAFGHHIVKLFMRVPRIYSLSIPSRTLEQQENISTKEAMILTILRYHFFKNVTYECISILEVLPCLWVYSRCAGLARDACPWVVDAIIVAKTFGSENFALVLK